MARKATMERSAVVVGMDASTSVRGGPQGNAFELLDDSTDGGGAEDEGGGHRIGSPRQDILVGEMENGFPSQLVVSMSLRENCSEEQAVNAEWACPQCTFINSGASSERDWTEGQYGLLLCQVCEWSSY